MSVRVPLNKISMSERTQITKKLRFNKKETEYNKFKPSTTIWAYDIDDPGDVGNSGDQGTTGDVSDSGDQGTIYLPFWWALKNIKEASRPKRDVFQPNGAKFTGLLRPLQEEVKSEAIRLLNKYGSCILSLYTGAGKTITSINLACTTKLKTLILCHRIVLIEQWKQSIEKFCPGAKIQVLKGTDKKAKDALDESNDFFIMNALNVSKKGHQYFDCIGTVIVDELHVMGTEKLSESFNYIQPRYLIGLSATPYRSDGMDSLLEAYFGKDKIYRKMYHQHYVYKVATTFEPTVQLGRNGKVDWNSVIESQTSDENRNELIVRICRFFKNRTFLILSKRISQVMWLMKRFEELGESPTSLVGVQKKCNYDSRILIATVQKAGVGFDHPKLDSLVIASDVEEYFIQYLGRIFRRQDSEPLVFDIVDKNPILGKHYRTRQKIYRDHGGIVDKFTYKGVSKHFPELDEKTFNDEFLNPQLELSFV
jgi:superfamily II DNA or RNA helicase